MPRVDGIPAQTIKVTTATRPDLLQYVLGGIHLASGSSSGRARVWLMAYTATIIRELEFANTSQKDDSISLQILPDGAVMVTTSEAGPDNSGASSQPVVVQIPGVFPPAPSGGGGGSSGGGGGSTTNVDQQARDMASAAQNTANAAQSTANTAKSTADKAQSTADSAKNTANAANGEAARAHARIDTIPIWWGPDQDYQKSKDSVYGELITPGSGIYEKVMELANKAIDQRLAELSRPERPAKHDDPDDPEERQD